MPTRASARSRAKAAAAAACDGGPAWDPVKTAMRLGTATRVGKGRTRASAPVVAEDRLGDADRLVAALALHDGGQHELPTARDFLDRLQAGGDPDLRADRHR